MTEPIRGKVAQVLSPRDIALNVGSANGVVVGMDFDVIDQAEIKDPDTEELLGHIELSKARVRVTDVQEKLAVATTYRETRAQRLDGSLALGSFSRSLMPSSWLAEYESLKTSERSWEEGSAVSTGDSVVQVMNENEREHVREKK